MFHQRIGSLNDKLCRTIIPFQLEESCIIKLILEVKDIVNVSTTERINTLIIIPNDTDTTVCLCQLADNAHLRIVRILVLIHKDIFKLLPILFSNLPMISEEQVSIKQNVIKIHGICLSASCFICFVNQVDCRHTCSTVTFN